MPWARRSGRRCRSSSPTSTPTPRSRDRADRIRQALQLRAGPDGHGRHPVVDHERRPVRPPRADFHKKLKRMQQSITAVADCRTPTIASVHGWCIGGGVDLISAVDIRYASADAKFSVREVKLSIVADVGSLAGCPILSDGHLRELALTGKDIDAARAEKIGLVNDVFTDADAALAAAHATAAEIAANSPLVVHGIRTSSTSSAPPTWPPACATWRPGTRRSCRRGTSVRASRRCSEAQAGVHRRVAGLHRPQPPEPPSTWRSGRLDRCSRCDVGVRPAALSRKANSHAIPASTAGRSGETVETSPQLTTCHQSLRYSARRF